MNSAGSNTKKVIIIPDSFKGSLSSVAVAEIISRAAVRYGWETVLVPIADGGEGSVGCILQAMGGERVYERVTSPEQKKISAYYGVTQEQTAVVEIAQSSGLTRQTSFRAGEATSYGFGELIRTALERGCRNFLLCLGGSATTDCGCGMAAALGAVFRNREGNAFLPVGRNLADVWEVDLSGMDGRIRESSFTVMSDVENPLFGPSGAAYVYAPQKGAASEEIPLLDAGLSHVAEKIYEATGVDWRAVKGAGAAGGAGYGCAAFLGAKVTSGIEAMLALCSFDRMVEDCGLIVTGEGKLDEQSLMGKVLSGILRHRGEIPVAVFCGSCEILPERLLECGVSVVEIGRGVPKEESMKNAAVYLERAAENYFRGYTGVWDTFLEGLNGFTDNIFADGRVEEYETARQCHLR